MSKNIKRIMALAISVATCVTIQSTNSNLMTKVYAASGSVYLKSLSLSDGNINFDPMKNAYEVQVDESVKELEIIARPDCAVSQYSDYIVQINKETINRNDDFRHTVKLEDGENIIRVRLEDSKDYNDDDENKGDNARTYTLYVNRGTNSSKVSGQYDDINLSNIVLSDGDFDFSKKLTSYNVNVAENVDSMIVKATADDDNYDVEINGVLVNENDEHKKKIDLNKGKNIITVAVRDHYEEAKTYTIYVNRGGTGDTNYEQRQDEVYLDYIDLSDASIKFDKNKTSYDVNVDESLEKITIQSEAEDYDNTVKIAGTVADKDNNYKKTVYLNKGKNPIEVKVISDDKQRSYMLNIYRGKEAATTTNTNNNSSAAANKPNETKTTNNINKWGQSGARWQYYDITGNPIKNTWFFDKNYGNSYYFGSEGYMSTGWIKNNGQWYYADNTGVKQTGWKYINGNWYYLDESGIMKTGWFNNDGKWYYLDESGAMASNTTVGGYKIGQNGYWIR